MKMPFLLIVVALCTSTIQAQNRDKINSKTPSVLISGLQYHFSIPANNDSIRYQLTGNDIVASGANDDVILIPNHPRIDSIYTIQLSSISNGDTSVLQEERFEVIQMPTPELHLGRYSNVETIRIHVDSIEKIASIELIDLIKLENTVGWYNIQGSISIEGIEQEFRFKGQELTDEILQQFVRHAEPTEITITTVFNGSDLTQRVSKSVFTIQCMSNKDWLDYTQPYHKLYKNKTVEIIQESSFYFQDTLLIHYSDDLYLHCLSDPHGNNLFYEFESLNSSKKIYINKEAGKKEKLLKMKNRQGTYRVRLSFNDRLYDELILIVH